MKDVDHHVPSHPSIHVPLHVEVSQDAAETAARTEAELVDLVAPLPGKTRINLIPYNAQSAPLYDAPTHDARRHPRW